MREEAAAARLPKEGGEHAVFPNASLSWRCPFLSLPLATRQHGALQQPLLRHLRSVYVCSVYVCVAVCACVTRPAAMERKKWRRRHDRRRCGGAACRLACRLACHLACPCDARRWFVARCLSIGRCLSSPSPNRASRQRCMCAAAARPRHARCLLPCRLLCHVAEALEALLPWHWQRLLGEIPSPHPLHRRPLRHAATSDRAAS
mmetsp:Transcript_78582/g.127483  ORF Transcript_78582/g.127483 Transcript_78582/m.127483 type:complete len:204 (-) Transcript_78582:63-674(-)